MPRILLIDDDEHLAAPLAAYFARFDFVLDSALRPGEGLARLRAGAYDAAILDVMLPEMDGFALCREIRKESDIPVIMLTARGDVMDRVVGLELGADDYVTKPFSVRELLARVRAILRLRRTQLALEAQQQDQLRGLLDRYLAPEEVERLLKLPAAERDAQLQRALTAAAPER